MNTTIGTSWRSRRSVGLGAITTAWQTLQIAVDQAFSTAMNNVANAVYNGQYPQGASAAKAIGLDALQSQLQAAGGYLSADAAAILTQISGMDPSQANKDLGLLVLFAMGALYNAFQQAIDFGTMPDKIPGSGPGNLRGCLVQNAALLYGISENAAWAQYAQSGALVTNFQNAWNMQLGNQPMQVSGTYDYPTAMNLTVTMRTVNGGTFVNPQVLAPQQLADLVSGAATPAPAASTPTTSIVVSGPPTPSLPAMPQAPAPTPAPAPAPSTTGYTVPTAAPSPGAMVSTVTPQGGAQAPKDTSTATALFVLGGLLLAAGGTGLYLHKKRTAERRT
jgi:hypothetical protein